MNVKNALHRLREDTLFSAMPDAVANPIYEAASVRAITVGTRICQQGDPADRLLIPIGGQLRLSFQSPDGGITSIGTLRSHRSVNLNSVLLQKNWEYAVDADSNLD